MFLIALLDPAYIYLCPQHHASLNEFRNGSHVAAEFNADAYEDVELLMLDIGQF